MIIGIFENEMVEINGLIYVLPSLLITLAFYLLRSIALFTMAKRNGVKKAFLAWIPCVWFYVACKLVGNVKFFGKTYKWTAILFTALFAFAELLTFAYNFLIYFPLVGYYLQGGTIYYDFFGDGLIGNYYKYATDIYTELNFKNPYGSGMGVFLRVMYYAIDVFDIISLLITWSVFFGFFKKFWPQHYVLAGMFSIFFGLFAIFAFIVRKNKAVDYSQYVRQRYGMYYSNPNGQGSNGRQDGASGQGYNGQGGYGANNSNGNGEPFGEYAERPKNDNPFPEFDEDDKD